MKFLEALFDEFISMFAIDPIIYKEARKHGCAGLGMLHCRTDLINVM